MPDWQVDIVVNEYQGATQSRAKKKSPWASRVAHTNRNLVGMFQS
jgi:hypothetical protein